VTNSKTTACALDCYDACKIVVEDGQFPKVSGDAEHPVGNGALCTFLNKSIYEATRIESIKKSGIFLGGTVDDCIRIWQETYSKAPAEYITLIYHWAQQPADDMLEEFDLFVNKVVPELEAPDYSKAAE